MRLFRFLKVYAYITPIKINYDIFKKSGIKNVFYLPFVYPVEQSHIKPSGNEIKILSIGKFQKRKDQKLLLEVFAELKKENYKIKLCLIGEAVNTKYIKHLHNFIKKNKLTEDVCIETNMPYDKIRQVYSKYELFVLPSYNEPAAYSPVEAMANGLPVICSDENGTKCYIEEGKNGFIFQAKNKAGLKEKIKNCISDKEKLETMQHTCRKKHYQTHLPEQFASNIIKIIND
jgi:glycosyltransferase involved in cell wall biosynthesis